VIYIHPFEDNFDDNLFFSFLIDQKQWREKNDERGKEYNVSMREKVVLKLSQNSCTNIIFL